MNYLTTAIILFAAMTVVASLGRLWRHRAGHVIDAGAVSQRWLSDNLREEDR